MDAMEEPTSQASTPLDCNPPTLESLQGTYNNYLAQEAELRSNLLRVEGCRMALEALINFHFPVLVIESIEPIEGQEKFESQEYDRRGQGH